MSTVEPMNSTPGSAIEPLERGSAVRFQTQCVVIPDPEHRSRRPRVVTKSYALPLWKRRAVSAGPSASAPPEDTSLEENQSSLVLRVPILSLKPPRSTARSADHIPLPPCLVHRPHSSDPASPSSPTQTRHTRTRRRASPSPPRPDVVTVPLRPCCTTCQLVTEAALVDGDAWPVHFSRGALRLRSQSADGGPRTITVAGSAASASYGDLGVSINVDEIDKRRRFSDTGLPTTSSETWHARRPPSPTHMTPRTPRIPEEEDDEDESELFPLPSPRRTPSSSPAPSSTGSSLYYSCASSPTPSTCSGDSVSLQPSKRDTLAPPSCSCSSLSLPKLSSESTEDLTSTKDPPRAPSPSLLSALPTLSGRPRSPSPRILFIPPTPTTDTLASATDTSPPKTPRSPASNIPGPITIPSPHPSQSSMSSLQSPSHVRFPWRFKRSVSADMSATPTFSPSTSPTSSSSKLSPTSTPRHVIADVLRGVGAMGSGGMM